MFEHLEPRESLSAQGLDASFGNAGVVLTPFSGPSTFASAMAFENDGKLVVAGTNEKLVPNPGFPPSLTVYGGDAIARYNADGSLDTSFGNGGKIETPLLQGKIGAQSVAVQGDGKILLIGSNGLTRYNADGSVDTSFGTSGVVASPGGGNMALQGDQIIVSGGGLRRYHADGSLDTTFGNQGVVSGQGFGQVVVDPQAKIVVASYNKILRFNSDGSPDTSFGKDGQVTVTASASGGHVALAPDGKIVWTGGTGDTSVKGFLVVRYNADGSLDTSFGNGGMVFVVASADIPEIPNSVLVQPDAKIVVAGAKGTFFVGMEDEPTTFTGNVFTTRLNANGTLDNTWGNGGKAQIVMNDNRQAFAMAEAPGGQIAIAGTDFFVAQFAASFNQSLVGHAYLNLLARNADPAGLDYFMGLLNQGQISRAQLVATIVNSSEYQQHVVELVYQEYLHRTPDASGLAHWSHFLATGGTQEQLSADVLGSDEFYNQISGGSATTFLNNLFMDVLQRPIEPAAEQAFSQALAGGTSRTEVAGVVLQSPESNAVVVSSGYQDFLGRSADTGGLTVLTNSLAAGATWEELNVAFIASEEYFSGM